MAKDHEITVTVVVSGAPQTVEAKPNQKVEHLIKEALKAAGIKNPNLAEWKLRSAEGGSELDPSEKIEKAGITDGATLFLDPEEGGGGEVAITLAGPEEPPDVPPTLVDPAVSAAKLARQLDGWEATQEHYENRGIVLLGRRDLQVDVGFLAYLPLGPNNDLAAMPLAVRFDFENYDLWAPSLKLVDPITRRWLQVPRLAALDFSGAGPDGAPLNLFVRGHPDTGHAFLCKRGVREYHTHPEHSGDDWLLYRDQGRGTLGGICDLLWRLTVRTIIGINSFVQRIQQGEAIQLGFGSELRQGNLDQMQAPQPLLPAQMPPEIQAQLAAVFAQAQGEG
jgi:hypothetical protein